MKNESLIIGTSGRRISDVALQRGLRFNIIAGALGTAWVVMTQGVPLTMFLEALNASGIMMGLAVTIMQATPIAQLIGALIADRLTTRKTLWTVIILISRFLWFVPIIVLMLFRDQPHVISNSLIWTCAVTGVLAQSVSALWLSWMTDLVPERMSGRFWGNRQGWTMLSFLLAMWLAGWILDLFPSPRVAGGSWTGFELVYILGTCLGCLDIIIHLSVPEPVQRVKRSEEHWWKRIIDPLRNADFRRLTIAMGVYMFAMGLVSLGIVCLKKDYSANYSQLAACTISFCLGMIALSSIWGYVIDRVGGRALATIVLLIAPITGIAWFFIKDYSVNLADLFSGIPLLGGGVKMALSILPHSAQAWFRDLVIPQAVWNQIFAGLFGGAFYGGVGIAQFNMASVLLPRESRTMAVAVHWAFVGLIGCLGGVVAGKVMDLFVDHPVNWILPNGTRFLFQHVLVIAHILIIWLVVVPLILKIRRRKGEPHVLFVFSQMFLNNPFRSISDIYRAGSAETSRDRAIAVRRLGAGKNIIAVRDLIQQLDDASMDVREESAYALGSIGSPEAVGALVAKMEDPSCELGPQIAKALRYAKDPSSVDALIKRLSDPDRETKSESIRALGEIGDKRATEPLMDILTASSDTKFICYASDALARLHELKAVPEIVRKMQSMPTPLLKKSLAVSIGDLMGERDEFYKILSREQETRNSEIPRAFKDLKKDIWRMAKKRDEASAALHVISTVPIKYEEEDLSVCASAMYESSVAMAVLKWGIASSDSVKTIVEHIERYDARFAMTVWYLNILRTDKNLHDDVTILLGAYLLTAHNPFE